MPRSSPIADLNSSTIRTKMVSPSPASPPKCSAKRAASSAAPRTSEAMARTTAAPTAAIDRLRVVTLRSPATAQVLAVRQRLLGLRIAVRVGAADVALQLVADVLQAVEQ